jgi:hypothetical protein
MTGDHVFFIPAILLIGFVLGTLVGRRSALAQEVARKEAIRRRKARQAAEPDAVDGELR